jgi:hypothetical protein
MGFLGVVKIGERYWCGGQGFGIFLYVSSFELLWE